MDRSIVRQCNVCRKRKPLKEFYRDRTKSKGRSYECKECKLQREHHKRVASKQPHPGVKTPLAEHMMSDQTFELYYGDDDIRTAIRQECRRWASQSTAQQQDYEQVAWGRIALCESGKDTHYYITVGVRAVRSEYRKAWAQREYQLSDIECMTAAEYRAWQRGCF